MEIPVSEKLSTRQLSRIFDNMSESYKIFWFKAILEESASGETRITFDRLIDRMIVDAWYMVNEFRLNLGPSDTLEKIIKYLSGKSDLKAAEKAQTVLSFLENSDDAQLRQYKITLTKNVPYRLQAPFLTDMDSRTWYSIPETIEHINGSSGLIYSVDHAAALSAGIEINEDWMEYFSRNYGILMGWADFNLITYLQKRNPTVPGISNKIYPPQERKLTAATKYWKGIIERRNIPNIYTDEPMTENDISLDHFVPWSYIASDELWDLIPTTKSVNSSKSNNLPKWEVYFENLCNVEYEAYRLTQTDESVKKLFDGCKKENLNSDEIRYHLYQPEQSMAVFTNRLSDIILPIYDSAKNMGFKEWTYNK